MIRQAKLEDARALQTLLKQLGYCPDLIQLEQALIKNNGADSTIYVYELKEEIIGFVSIIQFFYFPTMENIMRITAICVSDQYRNLGIGGELLSFVENLARFYGVLSLEVTCSMHREQAHLFYDKNGYSKHSYKFIKHLLDEIQK
ncbi:GCN5-related N-acetyltransferase [Calothrix sp. NIES-4071]|nr:GCN5-related N-acetyltransferase [Calothrix sp. NIES-4071]BAZ56511.1 GCN5-related N-acetyltransferase [Calothrix sp. NIES-4105]